MDATMKLSGTARADVSLEGLNVKVQAKSWSHRQRQCHSGTFRQWTDHRQRSYGNDKLKKKGEQYATGSKNNRYAHLPHADPGVSFADTARRRSVVVGCAQRVDRQMPAAVVGDMCVCVGPPDTIVKGSATVMIGGKPAARMGDTTAHGGSIAIGCPTVMIGG